MIGLMDIYMTRIRHDHELDRPSSINQYSDVLYMYMYTVDATRTTEKCSNLYTVDATRTTKKCSNLEWNQEGWN